MKATELRIHNLVQNEKGEVYRVETIIHEHNEKKIVAWKLDCPALGISNERIKPIHLTEQWLIDLGFEKEKKVTGAGGRANKNINHHQPQLTSSLLSSGPGNCCVVPRR